MVFNIFLIFVLKIVDPKTRDEKFMTIYVDDGFHLNDFLYDLWKLRRAFKKRGGTTTGIDFLSQLHAKHFFYVVDFIKKSYNMLDFLPLQSTGC